MVVKYNIMSYLIGEGFKNVFKNKKSTVSSLAIMCCAMIIFGIFFVIGQNISYIVTNITDAQSMQVFIVKEATDDQVEEFGKQLKKINGIKTVEYISKGDTLNKYKEEFKEYPTVLEGYNEEVNMFEASYKITLTDLKLNDSVQEEVNKLPNVKKIASSNQTITKLIALAKGIRTFTVALLVICVAIAIFIISNTIRLTIDARKKEIFIMRYVGATNSFIRWPFIVEGVLIGILSGMLSIALTGLTYKFVEAKLGTAEIVTVLGITFVPFTEMFTLLIAVYLGLGIGIGVVGSYVCMRKFLKV